jgi:8-oxo-dGTP pyrophosphatase MutT (NUDIX family)
MTIEEQISIIREELKKPLPGKMQQYLMAPEFRGDLPSVSKSKNAGVMVCLFRAEQGLQLVFIKRREYDGPHGGQVSFPGGIFEEIDSDLPETAIRETLEEIGVSCDKSAILGALSPLHIPVSNTLVQPFVGYYGSMPVFTLEKREVEYLIVESLSELMNPLSVRKEKWMLHGREIEVPFYKVKEDSIWGATAMILSEFLGLIFRSELNSQFQY